MKPTKYVLLSAISASLISLFPQVVNASVTPRSTPHATLQPRTASVTVCVGVGVPHVAPPKGYVVTSVSSAFSSMSPGPCGQNNYWGINAQVWSNLVSGTTVCIGVGSPSASPPSGYVVTKVGVSGPYYNLGPCGANNGWGINSQVWSNLVSGTAVCVGVGSPSASPPKGYVVTKVGVSGPYYNLGPCGANNGWGFNSYVWSKLVSGTTVCMGLGTPWTPRPSGYVVTKTGVAGPYYNLGPCGANNSSGFNSQVWSLR